MRSPASLFVSLSLALACCGSADAGAVADAVGGTDSTATADVPAGVASPLTACPTEYPDNTPCVGSFQCGYGTECCCGRCETLSWCECNGEQMICWSNEFCFDAFCSPGCGWQEIQTAEGCASCAGAIAEAHDALRGAAAATGSCAADADCVAAPLHTGCGDFCDLAIVATAEATFGEAAAAIDLASCGRFNECTDHGEEPAACVLAGDPRCVDGGCRIDPPEPPDR